MFQYVNKWLSSRKVKYPWFNSFWDTKGIIKAKSHNSSNYVMTNTKETILDCTFKKTIMSPLDVSFVPFKKLIHGSTFSHVAHTDILIISAQTYVVCLCVPLLCFSFICQWWLVLELQWHTIAIYMTFRWFPMCWAYWDLKVCVICASYILEVFQKWVESFCLFCLLCTHLSMYVNLDFAICSYCLQRYLFTYVWRLRISMRCSFVGIPLSQ